MNKAKRLTLEERRRIEELLIEGRNQKEVAEIVGINRTTVYREVRKCEGFYCAEEADRNTCKGLHPIDYEIIGKRFGLLVVLEYVNKVRSRTWWKCKCDCGRTCIISRKILTDYCSPRRPLSCGCIAKQWISAQRPISFEEASLRKFQDMMKFRKINEDCWEWTGYLQNGTPKTSWRNKAMTVRRCMYLLINGTSVEPTNIYVSCGNPVCFNPDHLTLDRSAKRSNFRVIE